MKFPTRHGAMRRPRLARAPKRAARRGSIGAGAAAIHRVGIRRPLFLSAARSQIPQLTGINVPRLDEEPDV